MGDKFIRSHEESKIKRVYLLCLIWTPRARSEEQGELWRAHAQVGKIALERWLMQV